VHRAAVGTDEQDRPADKLPHLDHIQASGQGKESGRAQAGGDPVLPRPVAFAADSGEGDPRDFEKTGSQDGRVFLAPVPEGVAGADVKNDEGEGAAARSGLSGGDGRGQGLDPGDFLRPGGGKDQGRDVLFPEIRAQGPDETGVGFDGMKGRIETAPGRRPVVEKALGLDGVADLETGASQERDPGGPGTAVKIQKRVVPLPADLPDEAEEIGPVLLGRDDDDPVDVGMALDQASVRLFDEIGQGGAGKPALEEGDGRRRQNDVAETAETEKEEGAGIQITL